jgi:hypothetical protein
LAIAGDAVEPDPLRHPLDKTPIPLWTPEPSKFLLADKSQPFVKLRSSHNWITNDGEKLLVLGADKAKMIASSAVLRWYFELFDQDLSEPVKLALQL